MSAYAEFLSEKLQEGSQCGFSTLFMPSVAFPFQQHVAAWNIETGKSATFGDCGLGKTLIELIWGENVVRHTNRPVLIFTPLAVAQQIGREAEKFSIQAHVCMNGKPKPGINITNYEKLHLFDPRDFAGASCDESSAIKNFNGKRKGQVTEFLRTLPYRLLATATAAPNDYIELGTSCEALGVMGHIDMLNRFFVNDQRTSDSRTMRRRPPSHGGPQEAGWRFKGHSETAFWRFVCSWSRAFRKPSDLGFSDEGFDLPPLIEQEHMVVPGEIADGKLFHDKATNWREERTERRTSLKDRCERAGELAIQHEGASVIWCHLNDEGDYLETLFSPHCARQVKGSMSDEEKIEVYDAFRLGQIEKLIIKPKIGAWGLNWQFCNHVVTFASHSWEQYYQAVRRCWRFGQKNPVTVDLVATEAEIGIRDNLRRKAAAADRMFSMLVAHMNDALHVKQDRTENELEMPAWI